MTDKEKISEALVELAKLEPVPFKAAAYLTAASNVLKHRGASWSEVPGVGEKIAVKIDELLRTGKVSKLEKLREQAEKREKKKDNKYVGPEFAEELGEKLEQFGMTFELAGSYRRGKQIISDVDVLVLTEDVERWKVAMDELGGEVFQGGEKQFDATLDGVLVNFRSTDREGWGAGLLYLTGSGKFGVLVRGIAKRKGFKLNQYGLFLGDERVAGQTEESIFDKLGLAWVPPKMR